MKLCLKYPLFVWPTLSATKRCMMISTREYGNQHHKNGPANAFRHAFWNFLIAQWCYNWHKNEETVLNWTEKITDWHENAFPNRGLAKKMDLHNNNVGRFVFQRMKNQAEKQVVEFLKEMTLASQKVSTSSNFKNLDNTLVHIPEES